MDISSKLMWTYGFWEKKYPWNLKCVTKLSKYSERTWIKDLVFVAHNQFWPLDLSAEVYVHADGIIHSYQLTIPQHS